MTAPIISAVITTFQRRVLVVEAIRSALAQTRPIDELIVVDDGSTDGTGEVIRREFGDRVRYVWQDNAGVSAARNRGLAMARGQLLALLDSDDRWHADKSRLQSAWLAERPGYGMVLSDVARVDGDGRPIDVLRRRAAIPEDGDVLRWVLRDPVLVPASAMFRREVFESVGGFDTALATAEDLDFHLRVARDWKIGVIEQPLVTAMRGHDGLSATAGSYADYVLVFERFIPTVGARLPAATLGAALALACRRSARGLLQEGRWSEAGSLVRRAWSVAPALRERLRLLSLTPIAARRAAGNVRRVLRLS
jgi:glycosyltransferase involved in cell wall biosynthesis